MKQTEAVVDALDDKFWDIVDGGAEGSVELPIEQLDPKYNRKLRKGRGRDTARRKNRSGIKARRSEHRPPKAVRKALRCAKRAKRKKQRQLEKQAVSAQLAVNIEPEDQFFLREHQLEMESIDCGEELELDFDFESELDPPAPLDPFAHDDIDLEFADFVQGCKFLGTGFIIERV